MGHDTSMRVYFLKKIFAVLGVLGFLGDGVVAAPQATTSSQTVAQTRATVATTVAGSTLQSYATMGGAFAPTLFGARQPAYWNGNSSLGDNYGLGGILNPGYGYAARPSGVMFAGGVQSAGGVPGGVIVAGSSTGGVQSAGGVPGGVIVAGSSTGGVQSAGGVPGGVIVVGGTPASTNAPGRRLP